VTNITNLKILSEKKIVIKFNHKVERISTLMSNVRWY